MMPECIHHFGGGVYAKEMLVPAGMVVVQHMHNHDHLSVLVRGSVVMSVDGVEVSYDAPAILRIQAGKHHGVRALTDVLWLCIHATEETDPAHVDEVLIAPGSSQEAMARIGQELLG